MREKNAEFNQIFARKRFVSTYSTHRNIARELIVVYLVIRRMHLAFRSQSCELMQLPSVVRPHADMRFTRVTRHEQPRFSLDNRNRMAIIKDLR